MTDDALKGISADAAQWKVRLAGRAILPALLALTLAGCWKNWSVHRRAHLPCISRSFSATGLNLIRKPG